MKRQIEPGKDNGKTARSPEDPAPIHVNSTWKTYQMEVQREARRKRLTKSVIKFLILIPLVFASFQLISRLGKNDLLPFIFEKKDTKPNTAAVSTPEPAQGRHITKEVLRKFMNSKAFLNLRAKSLPVFEETDKFLAITSLDLALQNHLLEIMDPTHAKHISMVVMEPASGKILSMISHDKNNPERNTCLRGQYPAASIFKIVTAAAAIEELDYQNDTPLTYNGRKYTLYKSQLTEKVTKYTRHISLHDAFAQSINPVFGKIGKLYLKKKRLETYADAFGFNQRIGFELPLESSQFSITDNSFNWAEIACGFNRVTTISPLHGAMIAAAIVNEGKMPEPLIVEQVLDANGQGVYLAETADFKRAIKKTTSEMLRSMMKETVESGTSKKAFKRYKKDPILSQLHIGGKTGSIDNQSHDARLDWFVGFAEDKKGEGKIVVSVLVAHQDYIGTRSFEYARDAVKFYFQNYFSDKKKDKQSENNSR